MMSLTTSISITIFISKYVRYENYKSVILQIFLDYKTVSKDVKLIIFSFNAIKL